MNQSYIERGAYTLPKKKKFAKSKSKLIEVYKKIGWNEQDIHTC